MSGTNGRTILAAGLLLAGLAGGCTENNPLDNVKTAVESKPIAQGIVDTTEAQRAVQAYVAQKGENPPSIEALEALTGKLKPPPPGKAYKYDPETGKIDFVDVPR